MTSLLAVCGSFLVMASLFYLFVIPMLSPYHEERLFVFPAIMLTLFGLLIIAISYQEQS